MALPLAMTMRSTTSGGKPLRNDPNLAESPLEPVIARRLGLNKVHDLSATEARVHIIGVPPSVGRMLLATVGSSTKSSNALRSRQRGPSRCGRSAGTSSP